jgi:hypothetical protein
MVLEHLALLLIAEQGRAWYCLHHSSATLHTLLSTDINPHSPSLPISTTNQHAAIKLD